MDLKSELFIVQNLGEPIPVDVHAVSVSLPKWADVVGYEEGEQFVVDSMKSGYPRFRFHDEVAALMSDLLQLPKNLVPNDSVHLEECLVFPSTSVGFRFCHFLARPVSLEMSIKGTIDFSLYQIGDLPYCVVYYQKSLKQKAKCYWQHSGEILGSRQASSTRPYIKTQVQKNSIFLTKILLISPQSQTLEFAPALNDFQQGIPPFIKGTEDSVARVSCKILRRIAGIVGEPLWPNTSETVFPPRPPVSAPEAGLIADETLYYSNMVLTVSGMAAIFTSLRLVLSACKEREKQGVEPEGSLDKSEIVVFGFPYLDTLKMMNRPEWVKGGCHFFGVGDDVDLDSLKDLLERRKVDGSGKKVLAVFTELPSNPLMKCPDLKRLTELARTYNFLLVVDDTISNFANTDLFRSPGVEVDILASSLTKIFCGHGSVMVGSVIVNSRSPRAEELRTVLRTMQRNSDLPYLSLEDLQLVEVQSRSFLHRSHLKNQNTQRLAEWLSSQSSVLRVNHPAVSPVSLEDSDTPQRNPGQKNYDLVKRKNPLFFPIDQINSQNILELDDEDASSCPTKEQHVSGYGCLLSFELQPYINTEVFYDSLEVNKGPSLGTNYTLVCPYTLLAHYTELPWAAGFGVPEKLIRVSVGLDNIEELIEKFSTAIDAASIKS